MDDYDSIGKKCNNPLTPEDNFDSAVSFKSFSEKDWSKVSVKERYLMTFPGKPAPILSDLLLSDAFARVDIQLHLTI